MAVTTSDFYWVNVFADLNAQADRDIDYAARSGPLKDTEREDAPFRSGLVEPQRVLFDLSDTAHRMADQEAHQVLEEWERITGIGGSDDWFHHRDLKASIILRTICRNCIALLKRAVNQRGGELPLKSLDDEVVQQQLVSLRNLIVNKDQWPSRRKDRSENMQIIAPMIPPIITKVSPPPFDLKDVPIKELRQRLGRGEIAPRKEWIPTNDKKDKKTIGKEELEERLNFAEKLNTEGKTALALGNYHHSLTRFTQGIHLLEYYECAEAGDTMAIIDALNKFRRNEAIVNLKLKNYRSTIASCTDCIADSPHDGKAKFLRAKAYWAVGDTNLAKIDLEDLIQDPYCTDEQQSAATALMRQILCDEKKDEMQIRKIITNINRTQQWIFDRSTTSSSNQEDQEMFETRQSDTFMKSEGAFKKSVVFESKPSIMEPSDFLNLLRDILNLYTVRFPPFCTTIHNCRLLGWRRNWRNYILLVSMTRSELSKN